jgi:hypothetical protein
MRRVSLACISGYAYQGILIFILSKYLAVAGIPLFQQQFKHPFALNRQNIGQWMLRALRKSLSAKLILDVLQ